MEEDISVKSEREKEKIVIRKVLLHIIHSYSRSTQDVSHNEAKKEEEKEHSQNFRVV